MQDYIVDINGVSILVEDIRRDYRAEFGSKLREVRTELNVSQAELSKMADVERSNITRIENGNYNLTLGLMAKLAESLGKRLVIDLVDRVQ